MGQTWGPHGADMTQAGPMLAPWTLLSGYVYPVQYMENVIAMYMNTRQCIVNDTTGVTFRFHLMNQGYLL